MRKKFRALTIKQLFNYGFLDCVSCEVVTGRKVYRIFTELRKAGQIERTTTFHDWIESGESDFVFI